MPAARLARTAAALITYLAVAPLRAQDTTQVTDSARVATPRDSLADTAPPSVACDEQIVSAIEISRQPRTVIDRSAPAWSRQALKALLRYTPTQEVAIRPFILLREGEPCTEEARAESERVLRAQPYIADATVRLVDDGAGGVRAEVETVDDIRPVVGLRTTGGGLSGLRLGSGNLAGYGMYAAAEWERGFAFREGFGTRFVHYHVANRPIRGEVQLRRSPLGADYIGALTRPFYTSLQHTAWHVGFRQLDRFVDFDRPGEATVSLRTQRTQLDAGGVGRVGRGRVQLLTGALTSYERRDPGADGVIITDSGFRADSSGVLRDRYRAVDRSRLGAVIGVRALDFLTVRGFDALSGPQDVGRGLQFTTVVGRGVGSGAEGLFATGDMYGGVGTERNFVGLRTIVEANRTGSDWENVVASGRLAWYAHPTRRQTQIVGLEYSGAWTDNAPYQLTLGNARWGVRGYDGSRVGGARRLVLRGERRLLFPGFREHLGLGGAAFADVGKLWAGSVPFGRTTGARASVGVGLLAAVPRASRRLARVDVAVPLMRDPDAGSWELRVSLTSANRAFWRDPGDMAVARISSPTASIFNWP